MLRKTLHLFRRRINCLPPRVDDASFQSQQCRVLNIITSAAFRSLLLATSATISHRVVFLIAGLTLPVPFINSKQLSLLSCSSSCSRFRRCHSSLRCVKSPFHLTKLVLLLELHDLNLAKRLSESDSGDKTVFTKSMTL